MTLKKAVIGLLLALCAAFVVVYHGVTPSSLIFGLSCALPGVIVATTDEKTNNWRSWNITAADADTTTSFAHAMGAAPGYPLEGPDAVWVVNQLQPTTTVAFVWGVQWNATTITLMKAANAGSGGTTPGTTVVAKLYAWRPHSAAR